MADSPTTEGKAEATGNQSIDAIAERTGVGPDEVRVVYERVFSEMEREAKIKDFVAIFAARKAERLLTKEGDTGA